MHGWEGVLDLLACPRCHGPLEFTPSEVVCSSGKHPFPIHDGIPLLAMMDEPEPAVAAHSGPTRTSYQQEYQQVDAAAEYNTKYQRELLKRWSTRREYQLLTRLLGSQPRSRTLLELPCGGGRLSPAMAPHADLMIEADVALGQLQYGRAHSLGTTPQVWLTASALRIPFRDASVDGVVCIRLCHHLPHAAERERLVVELLRVARRFVLLTFFDYHSLKNLLRRLRRPFDRKQPKYTMTQDEVRRIAGEHGARLVACPALSRMGSGHRYALLVKS